MKNGRPQIEIDWISVDKLCGIQATEEEICQFLGISSDTLHRACRREHGTSFAERFKLKRGSGKVSLRRYQWQAAQKGNPTMLIWLGKQFLDQRDKNSHEFSGPGGKPIETLNRHSDMTDKQLDDKIKALVDKAKIVL